MYRTMKLLMLLRIQMRRKIHMISLQYYGESGDEVQDDVLTTNYLVITKPKNHPTY